MNKFLQAATLPLALAALLSLPACGDDPVPTEPPDGSDAVVSAETCIDCHEDEKALQAAAAAVNTAQTSIVAAGDG